jgi:hypothetical protein
MGFETATGNDAVLFTFIKPAHKMFDPSEFLLFWNFTVVLCSAVIIKIKIDMNGQW